MLTLIPLKNLRRETSFPYPVENAGYVHYYRTRPENYRYTKLEVCLRLSSGLKSAEDCFDGIPVKTPFPHAVFKLPGHHHSFHAADRREALFFIYSEEISRKLAREDLLPNVMVQQLSLTGELHALVKKLHALLAASEEFSAADRIDLVCFSILEELLFQRRMNEDPSQSAIRKIASLLQTDPESDTDILELARENGFSERTFFRHWAEVFKITPAQYVMQLKMKRAVYLLEHTSMGIGEIAQELHFSSDNYFSTCFRRYFGKSPRACRRESSSVSR